MFLTFNDITYFFSRHDGQVSTQSDVSHTGINGLPHLEHFSITVGSSPFLVLSIVSLIIGIVSFFYGMRESKKFPITTIKRSR